MLKITDLRAGVDDKEILTGIDLEILPGEVHAIMGPNGSGKSTLAHVLAGRDGYNISAGEVWYRDQDLLAMSPEDRAVAGLFLAFQYPVELPGVNNSYFLQSALNAIHTAKEEPLLNSVEFLKLVRQKLKRLKMDDNLLQRSVNAGFSGGEKKRNEILQMAVLEPHLAILDETDSGLDIDSIQIVADGVNALRTRDNAVLLITHYQRLLNYIEPDYVHVLADGRIVCSGDKGLAVQLEKEGYRGLLEETAA